MNLSRNQLLAAHDLNYLSPENLCSNFSEWDLVG
jgi:hypothetical protein